MSATATMNGVVNVGAINIGAHDAINIGSHGAINGAIVGATNTAMSPHIENHGQIRSMSFPDGWVLKESPSFESMPTKSWVEVYAQSDERASVCFYYRGAPESTATGLTFKAILEQAPHTLLPKELKALSTVLRGKDDPTAFSIITARTADYNDKRVLIIEGRVVKTQEDIFALIIDAEGSGRVVQEIYYQAPKEIYLKFLRDARTALKSIKWKSRSITT